MSLDADLRVDRRRLKRRLNFWRLAAILAIVAAVLVALNRQQSVLKSERIDRISVDGIITDDQDRLAALRQAAADSSVKALVVRINSPGGTVVGGESLYHTLREVGAAKPVVVVMGDMAASAGYMVALGGDRIFARDGSITGSIGVIMQTADVTGLLQKLGVTAEALKSAPLKATPSPLEPLTPEAREAAMEVIRDVFDIFKGLVRDRRALSEDEVNKLADGRVFSGRQAVKNGLVDEIGGETEAMRWLETARGINPKLPVQDIDIDQEQRGLERGP